MKIKAAVFRQGSDQPSIEELELSGPRPGEVLVRMVATGVCHTDLKSAGDDSPVPKPAVLGHEGAGVVEEVGAGVAKLAPGDAVVMTFDSCGRCPSCRDAQPSYCHNANHFVSQRGDGEHYLTAGAEPVTGDFFSQSSFASHAIGTERSVVKVRGDAPLEQLGPLGCGIQTGAGAVLNDFKMKPGQSLAVFGSGTLGLAAVMAARIAGAARIVAIDRHAHRLALAEELGADDTILAGTEPVGEQVLDLVAGGVDFTLDTTSVPEVMGQAHQGAGAARHLRLRHRHLGRNAAAGSGAPPGRRRAGNPRHRRRRQQPGRVHPAFGGFLHGRPPADRPPFKEIRLRRHRPGLPRFRTRRYGEADPDVRVRA